MLAQILGIAYRAIATFLVRSAGLREGTGARVARALERHWLLLRDERPPP